MRARWWVVVVAAVVVIGGGAGLGGVSFLNQQQMSTARDQYKRLLDSVNVQVAAAKTEANSPTSTATSAARLGAFVASCSEYANADDTYERGLLSIHFAEALQGAVHQGIAAVQELFSINTGCGQISLNQNVALIAQNVKDFWATNGSENTRAAAELNGANEEIRAGLGMGHSPPDGF